MRSLPVDVAEIAFWMNRPDREDECVLDTETGAVIHLPLRVMQAAEQALPPEALPVHERPLLPVAISIVADRVGRYPWVPVRPDAETFADMADFAEGLDNPRLRQRLERAMTERGALDRYREILKAYPAVRMYWDEFRTGRERESVLAWLQTLAIEPEPPAGDGCGGEID